MSYPTFPCGIALTPSALDSLEADVERAIEGWTWAATELGKVRDENRYLTLSLSVAMQILSDPAIEACLRPKQHAAFLRLKEGTVEEILNPETEG